MNEFDIVFSKKLINFSDWKIDKKLSIFVGYLSYGMVELGFRLAERDTELCNYLERSGFSPKKYRKLIDQIETL